MNYINNMIFAGSTSSSSSSSRFNRYESSQSRSRASSFSRHQNSNDGCSPGNTTPGNNVVVASGNSSSTTTISNSSITSSNAMPAPSIASAVVSSGNNNSSGNSGAISTTLPSVVGQSSLPMSPAAMVQARMRMARNARHTIDFDFNDVGRRFRNFDDYSANNNNGNNNTNNGGNSNNTSQSQEEDAGVALRSDSPVIARLGPAVNCNSSSGTGSVGNSSEILEVTLNNSSSNNNNSRRRCGKTSVDLRHHVHNPRFQLPEQLEECPSSGDEGVVSPRKRIKMDYHHHHHSNASAVSCKFQFNVNDCQC